MHHSTIFSAKLVQVDLSKFSNRGFSHGRSIIVRILWIISSNLFFNTWIPYPSLFKVIVLRFFGAKIGRGTVIRPLVRIKYPWNLTVGDSVWIGESVWIDNLVKVVIGSNVCLSQGSFLLTGNHDYKRTAFNLVTGEIHLEDGVWVGAKALVGPGVRCQTHAVLSAGSAAFNDLESYRIYQGNPALVKRDRIVN